MDFNHLFVRGQVVQSDNSTTLISRNNYPKHMFCDEIRIKTRPFLHIILLMKESIQQEIHFNLNVFWNKCHLTEWRQEQIRHLWHLPPPENVSIPFHLFRSSTCYVFVENVSYNCNSLTRWILFLQMALYGSELSLDSWSQSSSYSQFSQPTRFFLNIGQVFVLYSIIFLHL